jgi:uncharacterized protein YjdB
MPALRSTSSIYSFFIYSLFALFLSGCGGGSGDSGDSGGGSGGATPVVSLASLAINPVESSLKVAATFQLTVTGTYSNSSSQNLTSLATWSVANTSVLNISSTGLVTALSAGTSIVTATYEGLTVERSILVKALLNLRISPASVTLAIASSQQLSVTGTYTDDSVEGVDSLLTWESSEPNIASISTSGVILAVSAGTMSVTASLQGVSEAIQVTVLPNLVSLTINDLSSSLKVSDTFQLIVTGTYSDASTQNVSSSATWAVADAAILNISSAGLVTALSEGSTIVTAAYEGLTIERSISVKALLNLRISPASVTLAIASSQQLNVTGTYTDDSVEGVDSLVTWQSSDSSVATISTSGLILAISAGTISVTASLQGVSEAIQVTVLPHLVSLTINDVSSTMKVSDTFQLIVTGTYSDASTQNLTVSATWSVADTSVLNVTSAGLVTALSSGASTVTAAYEGLAVERSITVKALLDLLISPGSVTLAITSSQQLSVNGQYTDDSVEAVDSLVTWQSSDPSVATISSSGRVLAISPGTISVTATLQGLSKATQVTVLPNLDSLSSTEVIPNLKIFDTFQLTLTGIYSDASTQNLTSLATWSVVDATVLSVSSTGLVSALSAGTTILTAAYEGLTVERSISVKALADLSISPTSLTLAIASSEQLSVTGRYTDNSVEAFGSLVTWQTTDINVASISNSGVVLGVAKGTISITASAGSVSSSLSVIVSPATLQSIVVSSHVSQLAAGLTSSFSAKGLYSDGTEQVLSDQVIWSVSDESIASIDPDTGLLSALETGAVSVIATKEGLSNALSFFVTQATLSGIAITPSDITLAAGSSDQVNITAVFSDNTKLDVSSQVDWINSNDQIAIIDDNSSTVMALSVASTILSATLSGQQADLLINVTDAQLVSLSLSPVNASIPLGQSQRYTAQGTYTDASVQDLSSEVTWLSSNEGLALISNTGSLAGLAESVASGSVTLTAVFGDIQQHTSLTITNAVLSSIEIQPANQAVAKGTNAQISALGYYTDGSKIDLTSKVIWSSSDASLVDVLTANNGTVRSLDVGSALISAALEGLTGVGNITVTDATLQSISISPTQVTLPSGITQRLIATGTYSDNSILNISQQVSWQSDDILKATVSNNNAESGLLRGIGTGQLNVSASLGSLTDQVNIEVTDALLTSIQVSSVGTQLNVRSSVLATAIGHFSDSSTQDVSSQVNWLSSNVNIASIGNSELEKGLVSALSPGIVDISASSSGINSLPLALEVIFNPNLSKAINMRVQPNIIINDSNDAAQVDLVLVPSADSGVIADGTPITLTITEGATNRNVDLVTTNGAVSYSLQSSYDGFISLSASSGDYAVTSGLSSTDSLSDAISSTGRSNGVYENNTLQQGSVFFVLIRNLTNRVFNIEQINIGYRDPYNGNTFVDFPESPITTGTPISDGDLTAGEFNFIGYELNNDVEARIYIISYVISDNQSNRVFGLINTFNFEQ